MKKQKSNPINPEGFWSQVDRTDPSKCWEWPRSRTKAGYGRVYIHPKLYFAHRIAWELTYGPIPDGLDVLHKCDNPPCVNPEHLFLGTSKDNSQDAKLKGRTRNNPSHGMEHKLAKLTDEDVREIRRTYQPGIPGKNSDFSIKGIARRYGVAHSLIHRIIKGVSWNHL